MEKIGLFGGTFDPPHLEHINLLQKVKEEFSLDRVIVLPSGTPPHKQAVTNSAFRLEMSKLCFENVDSYEIDNGDVSYTYSTLEHFYREDRELYFIMGGDSLNDIQSWKNPERIFSLCKIICVPREKEQEKKFNVLYTDYVGKNVSSAKARILCEYGIDECYITPAVKEYISSHNLYQKYRSYVAFAKSMMPQKRFVHTAFTTVMADKLCKVHKLQIPTEKVFIATCLHDIGKYIDEGDAVSLVGVERVQLTNAKILHQYTGSALAKKQFPTLSDDIISAIACHATYKESMTPLELIVAIADSVEESRTYEGVEELRTLAYESLEKAAAACIAGILQKEKEVSEETYLANLYYKRRI